jgi:aryl-alcohol dehydrogenase-like predicted oxidoreductase
METVKIPRTNLVTSKIGLGTWAMGGWMWGGSDEAEAVRTIRVALDRGLTLIDTAPVYGFGRSEEIVGRALATNKLRNRAIIATKVGLEWHEGEIWRNSSPARIRREIDDSLRRLRTDYVDIYQVHWPDSTVPLEETAAVLGQLLQEGKIRAIGVSNYSPRQMDVFRRIAPIHTVQPPYNVFEADIQKDVLPYAQQHRITVLAYGALCRGLLTGKITADTRFEGDDLRKIDPKFQPPRLQQYLAAVAALDRFAREHYDRSVLALAVRWILDQGGTIALWGARRPQHLSAIDEIEGWSLDGAAIAEIDGIVREHVKDPVGPEFMAPPTQANVEQGTMPSGFVAQGGHAVPAAMPSR